MMNTALLLDPLFRLPFATGLLFALLLPLAGMYLRLRNEWLAGLAFAQMASAGALLAGAFAWPMLPGGLGLALAAATLKGLSRRAGDSLYALMMLAGWGVGVLVVANRPVAEQLGHALFDGQLYFSGSAQLGAAAACLAVVLPGLRLLSRPLLLARFFPDHFRAQGRAEGPYHLAFDLLVAGSLALATMSVGVMAAFALVFVPPWVAYRWGGSWRAGLAWAALLGMGAYCAAFALALVFDQPFGPVCAVILAASAALGPRGGVRGPR